MHSFLYPPSLTPLPSSVQSTQYIIPYPQQPQYQFQYQWWIIELELFVFLWTAAITLFPALIPRVRPVALTFIAAAFVLVMDNINALFFLLRNDTAMSVFDGYRIKTAQVRETHEAGVRRATRGKGRGPLPWSLTVPTSVLHACRHCHMIALNTLL